jgi:hypothetical protein
MPQAVDARDMPSILQEGKSIYGDFPRVTLGGAVWEILWDSAAAIPTKTPWD